MAIDLLSGLNQQQYDAVTAGEGPVLVLAGPGSGKTGVLTRRVAYLIREMRVSPFHLMAVTFTNKAAAEMRHRIEGFLGERVRGLQIGTFHSTCARILRAEHESTRYRQDYVIYDTDDQLQAVQQALVDMNIDSKKFTPRRILSAISAAKNELIMPHEYPTQDRFTEAVSRVYPRYQSILVGSNAMDFDDLLVQMVLLMRDNEIVRQKYQLKYPFVLVDEFQDTNTVQYQLVQLIAQPQNNVFVVGDEDQSIYAFRGADYRNVLRFRMDYPSAKVILLEQNYRSTQMVLDTARAIIDHNKNRTPKALFTDRQGGQKVTLREAYDEQYEATFVMEHISKLLKRGNYTYNDIAVMYRTNAQSRALEAGCRNFGIPYTLVGGVGFYKRREVKDVLAYLRVVNNPDDRVSFERVANVPKRGIGDKSLKDFQAWANRDDVGFSVLLERLVANADNPLGGRATNLFTKFAEQIMRWRELNETGKLVELFDTILRDVGYNLYLHETSETPEETQERAENVKEIRGLLGRCDEDEIPLEVFLQDQQLMTEDDRETQEGDKITLLTLHAAKGLEYPVVFITGLEDGLLPHSRAFEEEGGLEEERRLFYVGITRAKDQLYLTYAFRRSMFGGYGEQQTKSTFLYDIPEHLLTDDSNRIYDAPQQNMKQMTTWDSKPSTSMSRIQQDLRNGFVSKSAPKEPEPPTNPILRGKIVPFPSGSQPEPAKPLIYQSGMRVEHPLFGTGKVIFSKKSGASELVTVAFDDKKYAIKELDSEFAKLIIL